MMSNHSDMQDKYCGHCYDVHPIQSQYKGNHKRGGAAEGRVTSFVVAAAGRHLCTLDLNRVNIVRVTTMLVFHVGVIGHHVPRHLTFMLRRRSCACATARSTFGEVGQSRLEIHFLFWSSL